MSSDLVVVVPGVLGSELRRPDDSTPLWRKSLGVVGRRLVGLPTTLDLLALPAGQGDDPPDDAHRLVADRVITGWHVFQGLHTGDGYHGLVEAARGHAPEALRVFAYDWRLSNRYTAGLLGRRVERWLAEWRAHTGNPDARVRFVCHSMGGLVVRYYLEVLGGREATSSVLTLGTPFSGSVKTVRILTGDAFRPLGRWGRRITEVARTFPSLGQLLPTYRCVDAAGGPVGLADRPVPRLDADVVRDGLAFHEEIATAVARNGPPSYESRVLLGTRNDTLQSLAITADGVRYLTEQRGRDHSGDGTVATFAAVPADWTDTSAAEVLAVRHSAMGAVEPVLDAVRNKLFPTVLGEALLPAVELGLGLPEIVPAGERLEVRVTSDHAELLLVASVVDPDTGESVAESRVPPTVDGGYAAVFPVPAGLWKVVVTAVAQRPPVSVSDFVFVSDDQPLG